MEIVWDFSKLPESEYQRVKASVDKCDVRTLYEIHNQYNLSEYNYCCDQGGLLNWFKNAIEKGLIK